MNNFLQIFLLLIFILTSIISAFDVNSIDFKNELLAIYDEYDIPGATAAFILPNGSVGTAAVGMSDIEYDIPMSNDSRMLAASIGKSFIGATFLALEIENKLDLDDLASKYLRDYPWFSRIANSDSIKLRHLLRHTSGIQNHVESDAFAKALHNSYRANKIIPPEELIAFILDKEPLFKAGAGWHYSDTGYLLLGLIIKEICDRNFYDEISDRFLNELNLVHTIPSNVINISKLASGYLAEDNQFGLPVKTTTQPNIMAWNPGIENAGGGFASNPEDLVVWAKKLYEGEAISGNYLDDLLNAYPITDGSSYGISVAIHQSEQFGPSYGHGGWIPGYCSSMRYYPDHKIAIAFQINTDIDIVNDKSDIIEDMEQRLTAVVINALDRR